METKKGYRLFSIWNNDKTVGQCFHCLSLGCFFCFLKLSRNSHCWANQEWRASKALNSEICSSHLLEEHWVVTDASQKTWVFSLWMTKELHSVNYFFLHWIIQILVSGDKNKYSRVTEKGMWPESVSAGFSMFVLSDALLLHLVTESQNCRQLWR